MPQARRIVPDGSIRAGFNTDAVAIPPCRITKIDTASAVPEAVKLNVASTVRPHGVSLENIAIGVTGDVQIDGKAVVESGAAYTKGATLTADASGRAIATTTSGDFVIGIALDAAGAAGEFHEMEIQRSKLP